MEVSKVPLTFTRSTSYTNGRSLFLVYKPINQFNALTPFKPFLYGDFHPSALVLYTSILILLRHYVLGTIK